MDERMEGTIVYGDQEIDVVHVDDWDLDEVAEAENAFNLDLDEARTAQRLQFAIFVSIRRVDKTTPAGVLADKVRRMKFTSAVKDKPGPETAEGPLDDPERNGTAAGAIADHLTTGSRRSATGST
jgi:hypothetical protein